ncbi:uncharacterized protein LOC113462627 [Phoenix dactylifera]|uniref:Uncharacterized protein LOC113462627 n=1 Tax=Phoenix dactylifera TaxID=42345 RepID=A0A8B8Z8T7_PHODC|nr:uncharacterized protein LOC113462627 [Phoenix dactylifera]
MEAVYLVGSIASTTVTSCLLSLSLAVRSLLFRALASPARNPGGSEPSTNGGGGGDGDIPAVRLYEGRVRHARRRPVPHDFEYPVRYALIDLDRAPPQLRPSHLSADRAREVAATNGPVLLLTIPASVGYEQNPLSVYYCYDAAGEQEQEGDVSSSRLRMCIAEVTNTPWGERVLFVFNPGSDLVAKPLHVSPFMDMLGNWSMHADAPGEDLSIAISVEHPTLGNYFTATLHAKQVYSSSSSLNLATFFWMMPHKVAIWIYWQALKLWWKNVPFLQHPKYINPMYRDDALIRDQELRCCPSIGGSKNHSIHTSDEDNKYRWRVFSWSS